jgi:outer membrane protein insertion porin family
MFDPPADTPPIAVPVAPALPDGAAPGAPGIAPGVVPPGAVPPGGTPSTPPIGANEPPGMFPSIPGLNANDVGPDRQDPFPGRAFADIVTSVEEAPTGRFMLGIGASSWQGLTGNLTIIERNFDLFNLPTSWNDIVSRNAFRGGGQTFQLELMPGTLINRFQLSIKEPYLFDLPIGAGAAGYLFQRVYPNWTESRGGGRFSLGRQFGTLTYADLALRVEDVDFYGYRSPAPADYLAAAGHTTLATIRPSIRFDNRNAPFMTNKGQYLELSFEQGWGSFTYPKFEIEGRNYFTTGSRPDGSGKRILTLRGHFGVTGRDTPVYERFFAGNFGSLRGFQYRGVGPRDLGQNIGGIMEALGSVEFQFPLSANDMFHQVIFCDFGTVEADYTFTNFRASVGTGLRMVMPALGPLPLCFDLAFPVEKAQGDRVQYFNFTIGAFY